MNLNEVFLASSSCEKKWYVFLAKVAKQKGSSDQRIYSRIKRHGRGWVFTASDFADLGSRTTIDNALSRQARAGKIRKIGRGIYDYPRKHPQLGYVSPTLSAITDALSHRYAIKLIPSGAYAANLLGLSEQMPMKVVYLTDGPTRTMTFGSQQIILKKTSSRILAVSDSTSALIIQAIKHVGKRAMTHDTIRLLHSKISSEALQRLDRDVQYAPVWIQSLVKSLSAEHQCTD